MHDRPDDIEHFQAMVSAHPDLAPADFFEQDEK
jgi:hypothetical protein